MPEARYCTNCRAEVGADTCPQCGVYAGDVFDGRLPRSPRRGRWIVGFLVITAVVVALGRFALQRRASPVEMTEPATVTVVTDRPGGSRRASGAAINEAEAIRILRRHFISTGVAADCVVISSQGARGGDYHLTALNRCEQTRLGRWIVDGKTQEVRAPPPGQIPRSRSE